MDDNWKGMSCQLSCRYGSHQHAFKYQGEIFSAGKTEKQIKERGQF